MHIATAEVRAALDELLIEAVKVGDAAALELLAGAGAAGAGQGP